MDIEIETTEPTTDVFEPNLCDMGMTVSVSHLSFEDGVSVPIGGWQATFEAMGIRTVTDVAGRLAISTLACRRLLQTIRRDAEWRQETAVAMAVKTAAENPVSGQGVPALEGMSARESMMVAAGNVPTPDEEFGGIPRPNFLVAEIEAGARQQAEAKREAEAKAKERLAKQMKDRLR